MFNPLTPLGPSVLSDISKSHGHFSSGVNIGMDAVSPLTHVNNSFSKMQGTVVIGTTSANSRLAFFGVTPVAKQTVVVVAASTPVVFVAGAGGPILQDSTFGGYTLLQVVTALRNYGVLA